MDQSAPDRRQNNRYICVWPIDATTFWLDWGSMKVYSEIFLWINSKRYGLRRRKFHSRRDAQRKGSKNLESLNIEPRWVFSFRRKTLLQWLKELRLRSLQLKSWISASNRCSSWRCSPYHWWYFSRRDLCMLLLYRFFRALPRSYEKIWFNISSITRWRLYRWNKATRAVQYRGYTVFIGG